MKKIFLKSIIPVLGIVFFYACSKKNIPNATNNFRGVDSVSVFYVDSAAALEETVVKEEIEEKSLDIDSVLQANVNIEDELQSDSIYHVVGFSGDYPLFNGQVVAFGKLEKNGNIFAFVSPNIDTFTEDYTQIDFYKLQDKKWKYLNSEKVDNIVRFESIDLNNDGVFEVQSIGHYNMNGNCYNYFFAYNKLEDKVYNGGGFFSSIYEFKPKQSRIEVVYEGSWYMPNIKTIYYWKKDKLIPYKEVEVGLKIADMKHEARYIKYSENVNLDKDSVQLIYKKNYRGKKMEKFFEVFFQNN